MTTAPEAEAVLGEIRAEMARQNLSNKDLALRIDNHEQTVGNWLNGNVRIPLAKSFEIARVLGLPLAELVARANGRAA